MKVRVWVGKSRIAGRGLFTAQAIPQDTRIIHIPSLLVVAP
jgi:hypothetical protein